IRNVEPPAPSVASVSALSFPTERASRQDPEAALSHDLETAATAWAALGRDPSNGGAVQVYNYSVARIVSLLQSTGKLSQAGSVTISTGARGYKLVFTSDVKDFADTQSCDFIPADELAISGKDYAQRIRRNGIGAPALAERDIPLENARKQFLKLWCSAFDRIRVPARPAQHVHRRVPDVRRRTRRSAATIGGGYTGNAHQASCRGSQGSPRPPAPATARRPSWYFLWLPTLRDNRVPAMP